MILKPDDFYHTGVVVDDLEEAMARMASLAGYSWTTVTAYPMTVRTPEGDREVTFRFAYSLQAPHIELVAAMPGTVWVPAANTAAHHLGYFVDDLAAAANLLEEAGLQREVCGVDGGQLAFFAYYRDRAGIRIEIVDRAAIGDWPAYLAANAAPTA